MWLDIYKKAVILIPMKKTSVDRMKRAAMDRAMDHVWKNNNIQFPRFIAEAEAAGAFTPEVAQSMADSMDLTVDEVYELVDRAQVEWEKIVAKL
jgi:hypothetical protein